MDGMIDDSEDDILVWNSQTVSADDLVEESSLMKDDVKECDTDDVDTTMVGSDKKKTENWIDDIEDSDNSVYEKKYYKISEVESIIGETQPTIRYWEGSFVGLGKNFCSQRSRGGTRIYTKENIENLKLLQLLLRERRLTIEGAISEIKSERKRNVKERAMILLKETREELNSLIDAYNYILHQKCD